MINQNSFRPGVCATLVLTVAGLFSSAAAGDDAEPAAANYEPMEIYAPLAGKSWRGEGTGPDGKPVTDIAAYEFILGGRALQATHRLEGGAYGGRTIFFYDEGAKKHIYHYFTTAGFHTVGEVTATDTGFITVEEVKGHPKIAEVRSTVIYDGDMLRVESSHVDKDGAVSAGDGFVYHEIEMALPLFPAGATTEKEN